jgi:hypothetical protein
MTKQPCEGIEPKPNWPYTLMHMADLHNQTTIVYTNKFKIDK